MVFYFVWSLVATRFGLVDGLFSLIVLGWFEMMPWNENMDG